MCFVNLEKVFGRIPRRIMQWSLRKKGLSEILMKAVMIVYECSKTKVIVGSEFSEVFSAMIGVQQGSVLSSLLFAIVVDVVTENAREGLMKKVLYTNDLVLMCETIAGLKGKVF